MTRMLGSLLVLGGTALAQVPATDLEQVWLDGAGRGSLWVNNGRVLTAGQFRAGAGLTYAFGAFRSSDLDAPSSYIPHRWGFQAFGAVGVFDWLEVQAMVPVVFFQRGSSAVPVAQAGLGNPWLSVRIPVWTDATKPLLLSAGVGVALPVGTAAALGNGGVAVAPKISAGHLFRHFQVGVELGGVFRASTDFSPLTQGVLDVVGPQLALGAMVASLNEKGPVGEFSFRGFAPLTGGRVGVETLLGVRWPIGEVELFAAAGPGLFGEPSTPAFRSVVGVGLSNVPRARPPCVEGRPSEVAVCPDADFDGDGVLNVKDAAPMEPEDRDGFQDDDGAPERDNDADGVTDDADACAMVAGVMENAGCPDVDVDEDGVVDRLDACRSLQGPAENQGCPDGDAIIDRLDRCPSVVGPAENRGCPWPDTDADGVADGEDNCPVEPGPASNAGCPSTKKQLVFLTSDRLVLKEQVLFGAGVATILPQSQRLIANLAEVLKSHPSVRVRIEGHTDAQGDEAQNLALSKARAEAVLNELASLGVRRSQLASDGFGGGRPMGPNDTAAGRQANRRVEFIVIPGDSE